jgi:magnesium and cobalt transporter
MTKNSSNKTWLQKIKRFFLHKPKNKQQLLQLINEAQDEHLLDSASIEMLKRVITVSDKQVRDAMIPRSKMTVVPSHYTAEEALPIITQSGHSRFPVTTENQDKIIGILLAKDLLKVFNIENKKKLQIQRLMRPANYVPESKPLDILLKEFREDRNHMAIIIDEYGSTAGLITIEDVLEEIVGEIDDEHDPQKKQPRIKELDEKTFILNPLTAIEEFNEFFGVDFQHENFDTIGGLLLKKFSHVPKKGEKTTIDKFNFSILEANQRGIKSIKVKINA